MKKPLYLILLGAPGAGKGTQAVELSGKFRLAQIASGDLFRQEQASGTELGKLAKSYMEKGQLVPDEITVKMVLERMGKRDCESGCILDGFPRTVDQARALDEALAKAKKEIDLVLYIKVSNQELLRRLGQRWICRDCQAPFSSEMPPDKSGKCTYCGGELYQRADDTVETARKRLDVYFEQTVPLIEYYSRKGKLAEINGEKSIEEVRQELVSCIQTRFGK